eukprot:5381094-Prymnesium_polylepis.1
MGDTSVYGPEARALLRTSLPRLGHRPLPLPAYFSQRCCPLRRSTVWATRPRSTPASLCRSSCACPT